MKQWIQPKVIILSYEKTMEFDSSKWHYCHVQDGNCEDYNSGNHPGLGHSDPNWFDDHVPNSNHCEGHTCCCSDLFAVS